MVALDPGAAGIVVAVITTVGGFLGLWFQNRRVHSDNRADHAAVADRFDSLSVDVGGIKVDVAGIKVDVASMKFADRDHDARLGALESAPVPNPPPDPPEV